MCLQLIILIIITIILSLVLHSTVVLRSVFFSDLGVLLGLWEIEHLS